MSDMIFFILELIEIFLKGMMFEVGDIIVIGMLFGVGKGFKLLKFLWSGDKIDIMIDLIGMLLNLIG